MTCATRACRSTTCTLDTLAGESACATNSAGSGRVVDDVDLLAVQLGHHVPDPAAHRADARALGVHARLVRDHGDLAPVTGLARDRGDLDRARCDLRHLHREQLLDQVRVRPGQRHRRPAVALAHVQHVAAQPLAVHVTLAGHLLGGRQDRFQLAQVDEHRARILALLDDARPRRRPRGPAYSPNVSSSSASRSRCRMTWRAVVAAIRPKPAGVSSYSRPGSTGLPRLRRPHRHVAAAPVDLDPRTAAAPSVL